MEMFEWLYHVKSRGVEREPIMSHGPALARFQATTKPSKGQVETGKEVGHGKQPEKHKKHINAMTSDVR
jgi:hypothetical protein